MVTGELAEVGMYLTLHESFVFVSLQVAESGENLPEPLLDQVIVPVNGLVPMTVAVQVVGLPTVGVGEHVTATEFTVIAKVPLLGMLIVSPP